MFLRNLLLTAGLCCGLISYSQTIQVKRGPRPVINIDAVPENSYYPGQLYIKFKPGFDALLTAKVSKTSGSFKFGIDSIDALNKLLGVTDLKRSFESILQNTAKDAKHKAWGFHRWYNVELPKNVNVKEAIKKFRALSSIIEVAEPSYIMKLHDGNNPVQLFTPSDSAYYRQWHYNHTAQEGPTVPAGTDADIDMPQAWDLETGKPSVIVAVLDGGVDTTHPDLKQNLWTGSEGQHGYNWNTNSTLLQAQAHGSHVCGTIAAVSNNGIGVSGVAGGNGTPASGARIMNMQIFNSSGTYAGDAATANAFVYSADHGAAIAQNSWGWDNGDIITIVADAIDYFIINGGGTVLNGGLVVFSAGNAYGEVQSFPGNYPPVICVSATNYDDKKAAYTTYGSWVDISAPGGETSPNTRKGILSTVPVSSGSYAWMQGTSMACPHVSGVAALCVSKSPGKLTAEQLRSIILGNVDDVYTLNPTFAGKLGSGRLNAFLAVQAAALAGGTLVDSAKNFKTSSQACGQSTLSWTKNAANNDVIIAQSDTLVFGTPSGVLNVGAYIPGGGKVIYKGSATNFLVSVPSNKRQYFRIWSFSGTNYSFHRTTSVLYSFITSAPVIADGGGCDVNISWTDVLGCTTDSIMLIADNKTPFGAPSGIMKVGDTVAGGAKIIYKGKGTSYVFNSNIDSNVYVQKWNFNDSHEYSNPYAATYDFVSKLNSIAYITANAVGNTEIDVTWASAASDCFGGSTYMLAYSSNSTFGNPSGTYSVGNNIAGGGKVLYIGNNTSFNHIGLTENTDYCYKVWRVRNNSEYSLGKLACGKTFCNNFNFQLPFADGFNGDNLSDPNLCLWTIVNNTSIPEAIKIVTSSANPSATPAEGSAMLRFYSFNISSDQTARLKSGIIQKGAGNSMDVLFRWYQDTSNYKDPEQFGTEGVTVQWSADNNNWKSLEFYPRVPIQGPTGWSYKQITLPDTAAAKDNIYISFLFNSRFGLNCYLDDLKFKISSYKPSNGITRTAACESTDSISKWTNYYDSTGDRLLSIKKNGNNIGKADQQGFVLKVGGNTNTTAIPISGTNYVTNTGGWKCMNRFYTVKPITEPTDTVGIRFYYSTSDFNSLNAAAASLTPPRSSIAHTDMYAYKINDIDAAYNIDPTSLHTNIPSVSSYKSNGFAQYYSGHVADTVSWKYRYLGNDIHSMEYTVGHLGGGGLGIGSVNGMGAKLPAVTYTFNGFGNWNNTAQWLNSIKPPASLPANALIIVDPLEVGECILNVAQTILPGGSMIVKPNKKFRIVGSLQKVY